MPDPESKTTRILRRAALGFVFLWFFLGGIAHFAATNLEASIVPAWVPWPREVVWASGVCELLGAIGLLWRPTRRAAGWGLALLTIAVTPANVEMLRQAERFPSIPYGLLVARLPAQLVLLALILWASRAVGRRRA